MNEKIKYDYLAGIKALNYASKTFPSGSGIYKFLDCNQKILYVGKAKNLKKRITSYLNKTNQTNRIKLLINQTSHIKFIKTLTEVDSFILENNLIKQNKPRFNIRLIDDKSYPFINISYKDKWPRIKKYRGKQDKNDVSFGPFSSVNAVDNVIKQIEGAFLLRSCTDNIFKSRKRPCILYQIKRCSAPCVGLIDNNNYKELVENAISFLSGKNSEIKNKLIDEMKLESKLQNYEKAALVRDRISALSKISNEKYSDLNNKDNFDIIFLKQKIDLISIHIFFFRNGKNLGNKDYLFENNLFDETEKIFSQFLYFFYTKNNPPREIFLNIKPLDINILQSLFLKFKNKVSIKIPVKGKKKMLLKMVEENVDASLEKKTKNRLEMRSILASLKKEFKLKNVPNRIEIYDNSHLNGTNPIGVMVVYENGNFIKKNYRKFNIITTQNNSFDDYYMMKQVIERRFKISNNWKKNMPDLILIDGGKGQVNTVKDVLSKKKLTQIDLMGIAKGKNRNSYNEKIYYNDNLFQLEQNNKILFFLQRLSDEAHRFAVNSTKLNYVRS